MKEVTKKKCGKCNCPKGKKHNWNCPKCGYGHKYSNKTKYTRGSCMWCGYCSLGHKWERDKNVTSPDGKVYVCINCGEIGVKEAT